MKVVRNRSRLLLLIAALFIVAVSVSAEDVLPTTDTATAATADQPQQTANLSEESQAEALQKAVQNPFASLIRVPLQNNTNMSYGPYNRTQDVLNLQPVIPVKLSMGPSVVLLAQPPHWTIGVLINPSLPPTGGPAAGMCGPFPWAAAWEKS